MNGTIYINARFLTQKLTGVQRFAYEISKNLSVILKDRVVLIVPKSSKILSCYKHDFIIERVGVNKGHIWEQIDLFIFLKNKNNPLLLNLTNSGPILYSNQVSTVHDISFYINKKWFTYFYRNFYKFITPKLIKKSSKILTVSNFSKETILKYFTIDNNKIIVINNASTLNISQQINTEEINSNYILFVGADSLRKNLINALKAFNQIKNLDIKIKIVGLGKSYNLKDEILQNKNIEIINQINDIDLCTLYSNAKMLLFPSFYEGFGIPPIEAMRCKCPVIASDIPVFREIYGDAVLYINPSNVNEIKNSIIKILNDENLRLKLIELGLMQSQKYSWKKSADKLIKSLQLIS